MTRIGERCVEYGECIYIYIYNTYKKKSIVVASVLRFLDGLIRTDAKRSKVGPAVTMIDPLWCTSVLLDPRAFLYKHVLSFFFLIVSASELCLFRRLRAAYVTRSRVSEPANCSRKKKKKIVQTNVRARQSPLNDKPDSQDRYARAKLWLGLCEKRACCNMLWSEINATFNQSLFALFTDPIFGIARYK